MCEVQDFRVACRLIKEDQAKHGSAEGPESAAKFKEHVLEGAWLTYCVAATARGHEPRELRLKDVLPLDPQPSHVIGERKAGRGRSKLALPARSQA